MLNQELHELISKTHPNICQISVYKQGEAVFSDEWHGYKKEDACHVMSATKSIVALLIGIAVDKGMIKSIDDSILTYFPNYQVKRGEKTIQDVTIRHLLTMTAPYKGKGDPWTKVCSSEDWTSASLDFLGGRKGLTDEFNYRTVCLHILTGLLYEVSNMTTVAFANTYLFAPIGIKEVVNDAPKTAEAHKQFTMNKTPKTHIWLCDPKHIAAAGYGLCLSATDMAKIGQLCLNKGNYEGKQIISSEWINACFKPTSNQLPDYHNLRYGYLWWILDDKKETYGALGNSGNVIYINTEKNLVVAITSYFKPSVLDRIDFIETYIAPFILK